MQKAFLLRAGCGIPVMLCFLMGGYLSAQDIRPAPSPDGMASEQTSDTVRDESTDVNRLVDMPLESLGEVPVISTFTDPIVEAVSKTPEKASEAPGIVDVITAKDIEEFGAKNLYEVLQWATSVYMTGSFFLPYNVACIRGDLRKHEDNLVLVLINDRPFRDTTLGGINVPIYKAFPIHMIERIEIIRGPGSVLYGTNAFNGVINVVTKNPKKLTLHASTLDGSYGWQQYAMAAGNGDEGQGFYAGATYNRSKGWPFVATVEPPPWPGPTTVNGLYGEDDIGLFAMYRNQNFTANVFAGRSLCDNVGAQPLAPLDQLDAQRVFVDFGYLMEFDQQRSLELHFTYNYSESITTVYFGPFTTAPYFSPAHSFLLEGTYRAQLADDLNLMLGGVTDIHTGGSGNPGNFSAVPWFEEIWYYAYLQLEYHATEQLKLVGGMQGNMPGDIRGGIVPRVGVIASLTDNWTAKCLFGQAFRSPYQVERSIDVPGILVGNPNLTPELVQTLDVQLSYHTNDYRFAATYFHSNYFDLITRVGTAPETYVNLGSMEIQGVELENEWRLSKSLRWLGSVTYQNNLRDSQWNMTGAPIWMAKMGLAYNNKRGLNVSLMDVFYGACQVPPTATHVNPEPNEYHLASLNTTLDLNRYFSWNMNREMRLQFLIQNLFNEPINHVEFQRKVINALPAGPGRTFYGGFTMAY